MNFLPVAPAGLSVIALAGAAAGLAYYCARRNGGQADRPTKQRAAASDAGIGRGGRAARRRVWDEFSGRLEAVERVEVRSRVAGAVQAVHFREGALVKQGDLLITIDPAPYAAEVERAEAQVAGRRGARGAHQEASSSAASSCGANSRADFAARARPARQRAPRGRGNLRAAQAALQSAQLNLGYTEVRAPVSGRVGKLEITVGNLVAAGPGAPVLTTLVSVDPIYASFNADEEVVMRALKSLGADASASTSSSASRCEMSTATSNGTTFEGRLQLIDNQVDARSGTVRVRAVFDNADGSLMPGQFARLRMGQAKTEPALLVNERAIGTDQNKKFVMVVGRRQQGGLSRGDARARPSTACAW